MLTLVNVIQPASVHPKVCLDGPMGLFGYVGDQACSNRVVDVSADRVS